MRGSGDFHSGNLHSQTYLLKIKIAGDGFEPPHLIHETNKLTVTLSREYIYKKIRVEISRVE